MPYNNTPINPVDDVKGTTHLPMSRVKKILAIDDEISQVSNHAVFLCTRAAELFVRQLAEQAFLADRARGNKQKKSLHYDDIAKLVHRTDNLEFLCDVIPESTTFSRYRRDKRRKEDVLAEKKAKRATLAAGQTTLDGQRGGAGAGSGAKSGAGADGLDVGASSRPGTSGGAAPLDAVLNAGPGPEPQTNGSREVKFRHYEPKEMNGAGASRENDDGDVQMHG